MTAAIQASWRLVLTIAGVVAVPAVMMSTLCGAVFGTATAVSVATAFTWFAVSPFTHELAHAVAHVALSDRDRSVVGGVGRWGSGQVVRWSLHPVADGLVAVAGPFAAAASGLLVLALPIPYLVAYPVMALFLVHLLSLQRSAPDGQQFRTALRGASRA